jgi:hypothetical protein
MTKAVAIKSENNAHDLSIIEQVVMQGDLSKLNPQQRVTYYNAVCESSGLNPLTRPFDYISLNGKLTLYAKKDATEQLRKLNGISIEELECKVVDDLYIVKATAKTRDGRKDEATGAVCIGHLKGDAKANAIMKAETKAKRRVTLSISGLGWCDETEIETIPNARTIDVDISSGEIKVEDISSRSISHVEHTSCASVTEPKKKKEKEIKDRTPIQENQLNCLNTFLFDYPSYKEKLLENLKNIEVNSLAELPAEIYDEVLKSVKTFVNKQDEKKMELQAHNSKVDF